MTIAIAADHGGFELKEALKPWLAEQGHEVKDFGAETLNETDDYPDFGKPASDFVAQDPDTNRAILICKSGQGMAMVANKLPGVRAIVVAHPEDFSNDEAANVLSLAGRSLNEVEAKDVITNWVMSFKTPLAERHQRRVAKIE